MTCQPVAFVTLALVLGGCTASKSEAPTLAVGEIWKYETRVGEEDSTVTVLKLENIDDTKIVILRVDNVVLKHYEKGTITSVPFLPFLQQDIVSSLAKRVGMAEVIPNFSQQYEAWQQAGDERWIWKKSVSHALNGLQDAYSGEMRESSNRALQQTLDPASRLADAKRLPASRAAELGR